MTSGSAAPWAGSLPGFRPVPKPPILLFAIGGALFASFIIVAALALLFVKRHRDSKDETVATQPTATPQATVEAPQPSASASSDVHGRGSTSSVHREHRRQVARDDAAHEHRRFTWHALASV